MKCERRDNLWVIRNCPFAGRQKLLVISLFVCQLMKTDRKLNRSGQKLLVICVLFSDTSVGASLGRILDVGSCGHLLITAAAL